MTITAHIWHGNYNVELTRAGDSVVEALAQFASSYIPGEDEPGFFKIVEQLQRTGSAQHGWVDYTLRK